MAENNKDPYDVIIIGCGIAGATAGALLASRAKKKVLVLERATRTGGRTISFRGEGIKTTDDYQKDLAVAANTRVSEHTKPPLKEIIADKLLDGYVLESGGRAGWYTNRGRVSHFLAAFNKPSIFYPNVGFVWFDHEYRLYDVKRGAGFEWMSHEDMAETKKIGRAILSVGTPENAEKYDRVSVKEFMDAITDNPMAREFYNNVCTFHTVVNDPCLMSIKESMKATLISEWAKCYQNYGAWAFCGAPGHGYIVDSLADEIRQHGGEILTGVRVKEILIKDGQAHGVAVEMDGQISEIYAPVVICTAPPDRLLEIVPQEALSQDLFVRLKNTTKAGCITIWLGMNKPLTGFTETPINLRSFFVAPVIATAEEGFQGNVPLVGVDISSIAPTMAPEGKYLGVMVANILGPETRDKDKVSLIIQRMLDFADKAFPNYTSAVNWRIVAITETALCWRKPEDKKPENVCSTVKGLYFAGDAYGEKANTGGIEAACHSGILCANEITGMNFLELLPSILR